MGATCETCHNNSLPASCLPDRLAIYSDPYWRLEHYFYGGILGWVAAVPRAAHYVAYDQLPPAQCGLLEVVIGRAMEALPKLTGYPAVHIVRGWDRPSPEHLRIHLIPQPAGGEPAEAELLALLHLPEAQRVSTGDQDRFALMMRPLLAG